MQWLPLIAALICPIMMIFCMKGMMGGHKHQPRDHAVQGGNAEEFQKLRDRVQTLTEQNEALLKEIHSKKHVS